MKKLHGKQRFRFQYTTSPTTTRVQYLRRGRGPQAIHISRNRVSPSSTEIDIHDRMRARSLGGNERRVKTKIRLFVCMQVATSPGSTYHQPTTKLGCKSRCRGARASTNNSATEQHHLVTAAAALACVCIWYVPHLSSGGINLSATNPPPPKDCAVLSV